MSSNLKVNTILPSAGSNIGIGTNGGELNVDGGCKVQVGTALTLGHSIGLQFATQNLHSAGFEINQINASGIITASSFSGSGANLTSLPAAQLTGALPAISGANLTGITGTTINNNADNRIITGSGTANTLNGETNITSDGNNITINRASGSSRGYYLTHGGAACGHLATHGSGPEGLLELKNNGNAGVGIYGDSGRIILYGSSQYINFGSTVNSSNQLDDYEEGSWTATTPHSGNNTNCRYIKVGNICLVTGSIGNLSNSSSSIVEISGLPFNQRNSGVSGQVPYLGALRGYNLGTNVGNGRPPTTVVIENSKIYIGTGQGNGGWDMLQYNELGSSSNAIQFNVCYQTA